MFSIIHGLPYMLALLKRGGQFRPARAKELSTHVGKFSSPGRKI